MNLRAMVKMTTMMKSLQATQIMKMTIATRMSMMIVKKQRTKTLFMLIVTQRNRPNSYRMDTPLVTLRAALKSYKMENRKLRNSLKKLSLQKSWRDLRFLNLRSQTVLRTRRTSILERLLSEPSVIFH